MEELEALGFSRRVAEALHERGVSPDESLHLSAEEILDHFLSWEGIIGYTSTILSAIANIAEVKHNDLKS